MSKNIVLSEGEVIEALPNAFFNVKLEDGREVRTHLSGKMRINHIRVLPGDRVAVELSSLEDDKGRIVRRL